MKRSPELDALREVHDEIAIIRVINDTLPQKYRSIIEQFIQKLENQIIIFHDTEIESLIKKLPSIHEPKKIKNNANYKK